MDTAKTMKLHYTNQGKNVKAGGSHQGQKTQRSKKVGREWAQCTLDTWLSHLFL